VRMETLRHHVSSNSDVGIFPYAFTFLFMFFAVNFGDFCFVKWAYWMCRLDRWLEYGQCIRPGIAFFLSLQFQCIGSLFFLTTLVKTLGKSGPWTLLLATYSSKLIMSFTRSGQRIKWL
jgi:hypothetical protein